MIATIFTIGLVFSFWLAFYLCKAILGFLLLTLLNLSRPAESRLLNYLQDRAVARTLGIPVDVVRMRRRIDFH
jgi:hypothetical protein